MRDNWRVLRGKGLFCGLEAGQDRATKEPVTGRRCRPGCRQMHEAGRHHWQDQPPLLQEFNNTLCLAPALITTQLPNWMKSPRLMR